MHKIFFSALLLCASLAQAQHTYDINPGESLDSFAQRLAPGGSRIQKAVKGNWGNPRASQKLMVFYRDTIDNYRKALVLQQIDVRGYRKLNFKHEFSIGVYPNTSELKHVLFIDTDSNGTKEMVVVENGTVRCSNKIYDINEETGEETISWATGSCDLCGYSIFEQKANSDEIVFLGLTESSEEDNDWDMCQLEAVLKRLKSKH